MSSKTPKASGAKTVSVPKLFVLFGLVFVTTIAVFALTINPSPKLKLGTGVFTYELANTEVLREQGLSGKASLASDGAMLFVFETPAVECFWMKDMHFNLDMIWADADKKIVYIKQNVSPSTYPESFCPKSLAQYVIEVNAGMVNSNNTKVGDTIGL